jgi:hypothetical protein
VITDLGIDSDDIWNFDETGFRIGVGRDQLVITKQQRQLYLGHPTNRELVTAIEAVSACGAHIPLFLIFSGITHQSRFGDRQTFKESTIKSAYRKTRIVPFKPSMVLSRFQSPAESELTTPSRSSTSRHNPDVLKTTTSDY